MGGEVLAVFPCFRISTVLEQVTAGLLPIS